VEQTTEETPKTFTQEEVDAIVGKRIARKEAMIRKEYDRKYGELENVLRAGTGKESVEEMTDTFSKFYESKGITIRKEPQYSEKDLKTLAKAEADEIISNGFEEVIDEVDRLAEIGVEKMTPREKAVFEVLARHRANTEKNNELSKIGITKEVYESAEFKEFSSQFNSNVPISKVYDLYNKTQPKKEHKTMGSMKNTDSADNGIKEYYSPEEARKFTRKELDENPKLVENIMKSMREWKK
jgi:hypothetical protein